MRHHSHRPLIALFFVSFILISNVLLLNVVVAVLQDEFLANVEREKVAAAHEEEALLAKQRVTGVLDPVTANLTSFQNAEDLCLKIDTIYRQLDSDGGGELSLEFKAGLKTIPGMAKIHMTAEDFHGMMNTELNLYIFRGLCNVLKESDNVEFKQIVLMLKMIEKNIQPSIAKLGSSSAGDSSSASLRDDFDLRNEMQESHMETLDRQAETFSRIPMELIAILHQLPSIQGE